ncbi:hypothetical protein IFO69_11185 [Echinicola sp. CAU 1574]|uniref:Uncharacterized protein n=1 Tax=Echinicola arenosa TaxID=2774144 RepID=A0ABR9AKT5_9BACT|nr:hypothetical protein [Echinicola arenosa]MBD8489310.1 hypothetical protein [Echinicola arenosa]
MFDSSDYPKPLDEALFETWLEKGREKKIPYNFLMIIWNVIDGAYKPVYAESREELKGLEWYPNNTGQEGLVAIYDLYSESRIILENRH